MVDVLFLVNGAGQYGRFAASSNGFPSGGSGVGVTLAAAARTFISFMRPDFVKEKILLYNLLILRITSILKIILVIDNPYGSR